MFDGFLQAFLYQAGETERVDEIRSLTYVLYVNDPVSIIFRFDAHVHTVTEYRLHDWFSKKTPAFVRLELCME